MFKKYVIMFISLILAVLVFIGSFVFAVDPFCHYRASSDMTEIIYQNPYYQNLGIAKYTEYDTLITGTSMTQNFLAYKFDDKFDCKAIRLSFDGGVLNDFCLLLDTALKNNPDLKTIYMGLDNYVITSDSDLEKEKERIPAYLSDDNLLNDVKYLFNKDVLFTYIRRHFAYKFSDTYDFYKMHAWDNGTVEASRENVINWYERSEKTDMLRADYFYDTAVKASEKLAEFVENYPQVQFVFFAPPYSIVYWDDLVRQGKLDATVSAMEKCYSKLLKYENVRMFYFQNEFEMITDLDNYRDFSHYMMEYNDYMLECFVSGENEIDAGNYKAELAKMKEYAENYDYDSLFVYKSK